MREAGPLPLYLGCKGLVGLHLFWAKAVARILAINFPSQVLSLLPSRA